MRLDSLPGPAPRLVDGAAGGDSGDATPAPCSGDEEPQPDGLVARLLWLGRHLLRIRVVVSFSEVSLTLLPGSEGRCVRRRSPGRGWKELRRKREAEAGLGSPEASFCEGVEVAGSPRSPQGEAAAAASAAAPLGHPGVASPGTAARHASASGGDKASMGLRLRAAASPLISRDSAGPKGRSSTDLAGAAWKAGH